jgi:hypothetical protein
MVLPEKVLKNYMAEYYRLSIDKCQSQQQQVFNNHLVRAIRQAAREREWLFDDMFCEKVLRDRIRCYYKTHIQNSKKRLQTMLKNPSKRSNALHLLQHYELIQSTISEKELEARQVLPSAISPETKVYQVYCGETATRCAQAHVTYDVSSKGVV